MRMSNFVIVNDVTAIYLTSSYMHGDRMKQIHPKHQSTRTRFNTLTLILRLFLFFHMQQSGDQKVIRLLSLKFSLAMQINCMQASQMPLVRACKHGRTKIVQLLLEKGVIVKPEAMVQAISGGFRYGIKCMI